MVTDRIDGSPIDGSTITFGGSETKAGTVVAGRYSIPDFLTGTYEVTITGESHVEHKTLEVEVTAVSTNLPFSVIEWGSGRFGATYDSRFHDFFLKFARNEGNPVYLRRTVWKWNANRLLPRGIHVITSSLTGGNMRAIPEEVLDSFLRLLGEVHQESMADFFCGRVGPLPITVSPGRPMDIEGLMLVRFHANSSMVADEDRDLEEIGLTRLSVFFHAGQFGDPDNCHGWNGRYLKSVIAHEFQHAAGPMHAFETYTDSLMGSRFHSRVFGPSREDKLGLCIIYHDDTHPGNLSPDTNPTYQVP